MSGQPTATNIRRLARAAAYRQSGRHKRAAGICARILKDEPGNIDALCLLAMSNFDHGEQRDALALLNAALTRHPGDPALSKTLAELCLRAGDCPAAISVLREAISARPQEPELELGLADMLGSCGETAEAAPLYRAFLQRQPEHIGARLNLANCLRHLGETEAAIAELERALALQPPGPDAAGILAELYEQLNRVADAAQLAASELERWPHDPRLSLVAARCMRRAGQLTEALAVLDALPLRDASPEDRAAHQYERGALLDRMGQPSAAFAAFSEANAIAERSWREAHPGPNAYAQKISRLSVSFTPELVAGWVQAPGPPAGHCPVFLVGFPRSGTTLLDQVLDSHPETQVIEERGLVSVLQHELALQGAFPEILASLDAPRIEALRARYFALADSQIDRQPGRVLIDKLPLNITNAGLIFRVFPNARFILAVRHPADVCLSCFMQHFQHNDAMANFFSLDASVDFYAATMTLWDLYRERLPLTVHTVRYEDLLADFRGQAGRLLNFLGLEWDESIASFHEHARRRTRINTPSYHQVSQPLYTHARFRWHRYREYLQPCLPKLAPWISAFGYADESPGATR